MADDLTLPASGAVVATDEVSSRHYQLMKPAFGADGSATLVAPGSGLPIQSGYRELSGSAAANNTDLVSGDVSDSRWVSIQVTGTFVATAQFQVSNDNTNWFSTQLLQVNATTVVNNSNWFLQATTTMMVAGPLMSRYLRVRTSAYTSGTMSVVVGLFANPSGYAITPVYPTGSGSLSTTGGTPANGDAQTGSNNFGAALMGFNGANWDRVRNPNVVKTVATQASGDTSLWAPGSGNRWRLQRVKFDLSGDAAISGGGVLTIALRDGTTAIGVTQSPYVPGTGGTALGGWSSDWIDLGNGIQSAANNQDLNVNLSAALTAGFCRVLACGTQGVGTAA